MQYLFYFFASFAILYELLKIVRPGKFVSAATALKSLSNKEIPVDKWPSSLKHLSFLEMLYLLWCIVGLFSSQWIIFLVLIAISFIPKLTKPVMCIDGLVSFMLLMLMLINKFH